MEQVNSNTESRGVLRLEKSEEVANTILENSQENEIPIYSVDNSDLDDFLSDATQTQAEGEQQEKEQQQSEQAQDKKNVSAEEAIKIAVIGLHQITALASELTKKEIVLGEIPTTLFAVLTAPLIQKYKPKITVNPENIKLDSWMPELMALGGLGVAGIPIWLQANDDEKKGKATNGDK